MKPVRYQWGHLMEDGQREKYVVGAVLRFVEYREGELAGDILEPGDLVRVLPRNSGMGIYVELIEKSDRNRDIGSREMVFPEEVEVTPEGT